MISLIKNTFLFLLISVGLTVGAFEIPSLTSPVVDQAGLLSERTKSIIAQNLQQVYANKGPQIQVLVVASLQGETIEEVAIKVFDKWKLGGEKVDNGILFLIAPNEKKLRIEVGRGLEGDIPDAIAKRIVSDIVRPFFKTGEYDVGIMQGVSAILHYANAGTLDDKDVQPQERSERRSGMGGKIAGGIVLILWILLFMFNPTLALALLFAGRGGRGGSGGGGWSGGGGSSAGGGASGDW